MYSEIAALDVDFREAIVAVDLAGFSYRDAAEALHAPEETVASRVLRARRRLAAQIGVD